MEIKKVKKAIEAIGGLEVTESGGGLKIKSLKDDNVIFGTTLKRIFVICSKCEQLVNCASCPG